MKRRYFTRGTLIAAKRALPVSPLRRLEKELENRLGRAARSAARLDTVAESRETFSETN
jgi:hypothetical protein